MTDGKKKQALINKWIGLAAVLILAALIGLVVVPRFVYSASSRKTKKARREATLAMMRATSIGLDKFKLDMRRFPTTVEGLNALTSSPNPADPKWKGPYCDDARFLKDVWSKPLNYQYPETAARPYDLWSSGPDGISVTEDDVWLKVQ